MKLSQFNIIAKEREQYIVYNTFSTACVALNNDLYNKIFVKQDFSETEVTDSLLRNGILIEDDIDELTKIYNIRNQIVKTNIQNIVILTTTDCNARCYYCFEKGIKPEKMSFVTADAVINYCQKKYKDKQLLISWFGGEPLLNFEIMQYITDKLTNDGYILHGYVTTNGSLLTPQMFSYFKEKYVDMTFQITLDALYDEYGKIKNYIDIPASQAFQRTIENIKTILLNDYRLLLRVNFLSSRVDNALVIYNKVIDLFSDYDLSNTNIYMAPLTVNNEKENLSCITCKEGHPFLKMVEAHKKANFALQNFHATSAGSTILQKYFLSPLPIPCGMMMRSKTIVNANGDLYKCHRLVGRKEYSYGDVFHDTYDNKVLDLFERTIIDDTECQSCNILPICQGGCKYMRLIYGDKQKCCRIKNVKTELVRMYYQELKTKGGKYGNIE